jgi:hypothetical protein
VLYLVAIGWMFVVLLMSAAEALAANGSLLGALITFVLYGLLPLALVLYLVGTPARRKALRAAETSGQRRAAPEWPEHPPGGREQSELGAHTSAAQPDGASHAAGDAVAPKREEA